MKDWKKNSCLFFVILVMHVQYSKAQDPFFSQFFASPVTFNPALIGKDVANMRISTIMRAQWWGSADVKPFYSSMLSFEKKLAMNRPGNNSLAIAFSILGDASNGGVLKNNYFTGGISYNKALDASGNELLGGGISLAYANRIFDANKFEFQSQFGSMGFDRALPSNDAVVAVSKHYWDVNAGIHYSKSNANWGYYLGTAVFHAGKPNQSIFTGQEYYLPMRMSFQAGLQFYLKNKTEIHFSGLSDIQGQNRLYTLGGLCKIYTNDDTISSLNVGVWNRFGDAVYPYVGIEGNTWLGGISYDIITGQQALGQSLQSMEFSFVLKLGAVKPTNTHAGRMLYY
jgi:type IX secretion system PorP/SprF family membrane protein